MRIDWAVTCRYAESDGTIGTIVGAGIDVLYVPQFPGPVGVMLAVRLAATFEEMSPGQEHAMTARILGPSGEPAVAPDGSEAAPLTINIRIQDITQQIVPGWLVTPMFAFAVQWWAAEEGTYTIEVSVPDAEPVQSPLHVLQHRV